MYDFGTHFEVDLTKSKTPSSNVFRGKTYRISILFINSFFYKFR